MIFFLKCSAHLSPFIMNVKFLYEVEYLHTWTPIPLIKLSSSRFNTKYLPINCIIEENKKKSPTVLNEPVFYLNTHPLSVTVLLKLRNWTGHPQNSGWPRLFSGGFSYLFNEPPGIKQPWINQAACWNKYVFCFTFQTGKLLHLAI